MGEPDSAVNCSVDYAAELGVLTPLALPSTAARITRSRWSRFRDAQEKGREYDLPMVMWSYPRGQGVKNDTKPSTISYATRLALELGADIAKVKYPPAARTRWPTPSSAPAT